MSDESDAREDQGDATASASVGDGGTPLDRFWAQLDPIDA